jgi:fructokinase
MTVTSPQVLCLGEVLFDLLSDQPGRAYEQVTSWTAYPGGAPANVASALAKLGTTSGFVGCVGVDEAGEKLVHLLQEIGVNGQGIQRHRSAPTRQVYVVRSLTGDRQFAGFGDRNTTEFADTYLQASMIPTDLFEHANFLVLGTLELAYPDSRAAIARALELAEQHYVKILVDVNWRPMFWTDPDAAKPIILDLVKHSDFLKLSAEEADWLFSNRDPSAIAHSLDAVEGVLITDGDRGCTYHLSENTGILPAFPVHAEDTTGAGDAFVAGFLHQICQHNLSAITDPEMARSIVTYASAVGGLTATRPGAIAAQPTAAEVDAFLYLTKRQSGLGNGEQGTGNRG